MLATLGVTIDRDQVLEYNGAGAANATIERDITDDELTVTLTSSDTTEITLQSSVTMLAGVSSVVVPLDVEDDTLLDGTQTVTITASAPGFTDGSDTIRVRDIETLSLKLNDDSLAIGESTTAILTRNNTNVEEPLLVNIQDEHAADLVIPDQVEIPAGEQSTLIPISISDNGVVDGTRTVQLVVFTDGYLNGADKLEIREEGVVSVDAAADGTAVDEDRDGTFSKLVTGGLSDNARAAAREQRALFEFDISTIRGHLGAATLTLRVQGYSALSGVGPTVELFGYVGDGSLSSTDATAGQKVGAFQVPGDSGVRRYAIPLDLTFLRPLIDTEPFVGFSARIADGSNVSFTSSRNTFVHKSNHPRLQIVASQSSPSALDDTATTDEDVAVSIDVLENDFGDSLSIAGVGTPSHGTVTVNSDHTLAYSPADNFHGRDSFSYSIQDVNGDTDTAQVTVHVSSINDAPIANNDTAVTEEDTAVIIDVLANDSDVDNDTLSIDSVHPTDGRVIVNKDDTLTYTPDADFHGTDTFTYSMTDGNGAFKRAFVNVTVEPVNDDPTVVDAVFALEENSSNGTELGAIEASDVEGDALQFALRGAEAEPFAVDPDTGVLSVRDSALLDFETQPQFDFAVEVSDGNGGRAMGSIHVDLTDVLEIAIDVLPKDPSNEVRLHPHKTIQVAILATANFDPLAKLDLNTIRLRAPDSPTGASILSHHKHGFRYKQRDVDGDGHLDLVLSFQTSETGLQAGDTSLLLEGNLRDEYGGDFFSVEQGVTVVPAEKARGGRT